MTQAESKPLASLSGSLLARKGQASPAMRRQNMMALGGAAVSDTEKLEDLGWDDMGHDAHHETNTGGFAGLSPMHQSPVAPVLAAPVVPTPVTRLHETPEDAAVEEPVEAIIPPVVHQQRELAVEFSPPVSEPVAAAPVEEVHAVTPITVTAPAVLAAPVAAKLVRPRAAPGSKGTAAFTLRLDAERHLKLRVVCALRHRSAQQIVTEALDAYLAKQPIPADLANGTSPFRGMN
jgi:hypothetical protein